MSTNTIVGEMIAEHDAKQRKQPLPTPKEVHARMIEMTNAANGLRYEVARFGDIERQLKAVHEKMEPLVLKAKELNDLVCERVSQASQPWADSRIHESEELLQKVQQLERENAALRVELQEQSALNGTGSEREYVLRGRVDRLKRENAALQEDSELLSWLLKRGVCWRGCNKELEGEFWTVGHDTEWLYDQVRGRERIRSGIAAARKEAQP